MTARKCLDCNKALSKKDNRYYCEKCTSKLKIIDTLNFAKPIKLKELIK